MSLHKQTTQKAYNEITKQFTNQAQKHCDSCKNLKSQLHDYTTKTSKLTESLCEVQKKLAEAEDNIRLLAKESSLRTGFQRIKFNINFTEVWKFLEATRDKLRSLENKLHESNFEEDTLNSLDLIFELIYKISVENSANNKSLLVAENIKKRYRKLIEDLYKSITTNVENLQQSWKIKLFKSDSLNLLVSLSNCISDNLHVIDNVARTSPTNQHNPEIINNNTNNVGSRHDIKKLLKQLDEKESKLIKLEQSFKEVCKQKNECKDQHEKLLSEKQAEIGKLQINIEKQQRLITENKECIARESNKHLCKLNQLNIQKQSAKNTEIRLSDKIKDMEIQHAKYIASLKNDYCASINAKDKAMVQKDESIATAHAKINKLLAFKRGITNLTQENARNLQTGVSDFSRVIETYSTALSITAIKEEVATASINKRLRKIEEIQHAVFEQQNEVERCRFTNDHRSYLHMKEVLISAVEELDRIVSGGNEEVKRARQNAVVYIQGLYEGLVNE